MKNTATAPEPMLSPEDVSQWLGVPVPTLYKWRATGDGPKSARMGKHLRYRRADVEAWITKQASKSAVAR